MAKTNFKRLVLIAGGGVFAVVAILAGVFFLEYGGVTSDIPLPLPQSKPGPERVPWAQLQDGRSIDLEVPPKLDAVDEKFATTLARLVPVPNAEAELERAMSDLSLPIYIPEETVLTTKSYWERYEAYLNHVFDQELARLTGDSRSEFGETLELLKQRIATVDRTLQPDEAALKRLETATLPLAILADTIFRRDDFTTESLVERCRESLFALIDDDAHGYIVFIAAQELLVCLRDNSIRHKETDVALLFVAFQRLNASTTHDVAELDTTFPIYLCTIRGLQLFNDFKEMTRRWFVRTAGEFVAENPGIDPYPFFCLAAAEHKKIGWDARGTGWASEVPDDAWPIFERETQLAADYYRAAYALHDDIPYAPCQLIDLAKTSDVGGSPKRWLNRTLAIQRDYFEAYSEYSYTLSPRWGGSNREQVEFANVCIGMNDFGPGGISWECVDALQTIRNSTSIVDQSINEIPGYLETLRSFADAVIATYESDLLDEYDFSGMRKLIYWLTNAKDYDRLRHVLSFGNPEYSWTYEDWIKGLGASYQDPAQDEVMELYLAFVGADRPVMTPELLKHWRGVVAQARAKTENEDVHRLLDLSESNIAAGEEYFLGEWVNLNVHDDETAGRVNFGADHVSYDEKDRLVLESGPNGSYPEVFVRLRLPGPMLIDSNFMPLRPKGSQYMENFGIVAGRSSSNDGSPVSPRRAVYVNNIWNAMGYRTFPLGNDGPQFPDGVPVASWTGYRMGMLVTPTETRAYWHMKEIHREEIEFEDPFVQVSIRPLLGYNAERTFAVKYVAIHYCPDGKLPEDYDPANSTMHEKAAKRAADEQY